MLTLLLVPVLLFAPSAHALQGAGSATIVWMQAEIPDTDAREQAEKIIGSGGAHGAWADIAFPAMPVAKADDARLSAVDRATTDARARWDQFGVELEIAAALAAALAPIDLIRNEADRRVLSQALLLEGAAALRVVEESRFATAEEVGPYRIFLGSSGLVRPLVDALALDPESVWTRADLPDAASFARLGTARDEVLNHPQGRLELGAMPTGTTVVLDGRPLADTIQIVPLLPGRHYVHVDLGGRVAGRRVLEIAPEASVTVEPSVTREALAAAGARVLEGVVDVPDALAKAVTALSARGGRTTPTFLAALDSRGRVRLLPFGGGATIVARPAVTVLLAGSGGGGAIRTPAFEGTRGVATAAAAFGGDLGVEIGIYNLALIGGTSLFLTPTESMRFANADGTENVHTNAYFRPYGGLGVYLPRPDPKKALFLLAVNYGWMSPGALGAGGRMSLGLPLSGDGTWFRIELDAFRGTQMPGFLAEGEPTVFGALRLGFGRML